ncbi:MAG: hypothetical protein RMK43_12775, partial [Cyclobacteriaceae bacterium]|nr:hypothetical protein [Cyclobacteriaceae bacterium]
DRIVLNAPTGDLGHQFEFAAHHLPIPIFVRFDRHVEIGCRITIFGPFPYSVTPGTPIPGLPRFRILLSGVRSSLPADTDQLARMQRYNTDQLQQDVQKILQLVKLRSGTF